MISYYELLGVSTTAGRDEIQAACDERYGKWLRLITHHEDKVRRQDEEAIKIIELARETLIPGMI